MTIGVMRQTIRKSTADKNVMSLFESALMDLNDAGESQVLHW